MLRQAALPAALLALAALAAVAAANSTLKGNWQTASVKRGSLVARHEACAVMVKGKVVLVGGRGINKPVSIFDPKTRVWTTGKGPGSGVQIHHFQCVAIGKKVFVVSSWKGGFPFETNNDKVYIYNTKKDRWTTKPGLPEKRRRGGAAAVRVGDLIYVVAGNRGGHGAHATSLSWMDAYNWKTNKWLTNLPSMPSAAARDHVGGAIVKGQLCIAGGRNGGVKNFFTAGLPTTYCYNFKKKKWVRKANFPQPRAGAMTAKACDGRMMIAGGEGNGIAYKRVDVFDGKKWKQAPGLVRARHGSGLAVAKCSCGHIFIPSGSGSQGGSPELSSTEQYIPNGAPQKCAKY